MFYNTYSVVITNTVLIYYAIFFSRILEAKLWNWMKVAMLKINIRLIREQYIYHRILF